MSDDIVLYLKNNILFQHILENSVIFLCMCPEENVVMKSRTLLSLNKTSITHVNIICYNSVFYSRQTVFLVCQEMYYVELKQIHYNKYIHCFQHVIYSLQITIIINVHCINDIVQALLNL